MLIFISFFGYELGGGWRSKYREVELTCSASVGIPAMHMMGLVGVVETWLGTSSWT